MFNRHNRLYDLDLTLKRLVAGGLADPTCFDIYVVNSTMSILYTVNIPTRPKF